MCLTVHLRGVGKCGETGKLFPEPVSSSSWTHSWSTSPSCPRKGSKAFLVDCFHTSLRCDIALAPLFKAWVLFPSNMGWPPVSLWSPECGGRNFVLVLSETSRSPAVPLHPCLCLSLSLPLSASRRTGGHVAWSHVALTSF